MSVSIDVLAPQKSHIDLSDKMLPSDFGLDDYQLSNLFDDVILIEYCDVHGGEDGSEYILRGGIAVPINQVHNAWRKGKVILNGPRVQYAKVGDVVVFPNNMGIPITNLEVEGYGKIKNGLFINEQRMFGICKVNDKTENK
jgi:cellobiose-specific phosphotransferase system component IIB